MLKGVRRRKRDGETREGGGRLEEREEEEVVVVMVVQPGMSLSLFSSEVLHVLRCCSRGPETRTMMVA